MNSLPIDCCLSLIKRRGKQPPPKHSHRLWENDHDEQLSREGVGCRTGGGRSALGRHGLCAGPRMPRPRVTTITQRPERQARPPKKARGPEAAAAEAQEAGGRPEACGSGVAKAGTPSDAGRPRSAQGEGREGRQGQPRNPADTGAKASGLGAGGMAGAGSSHS